MRSGRPAIDEVRRGSDEKIESSEPRFIAIGRVIRPHGLRGELAVEVLTACGR
jgi:hypothetical protein